VLILMPAAVLVLLILGAISVDFSIAFLAQRQLKDAAVAAANDAAGAALDQAQLRGSGATVIDPARASVVAAQAVAASLSAPVRLTAPPAVTVNGDQVTVVLDGEADYIFAPTIPGAAHRVHVRGAATARLESGG